MCLRWHRNLKGLDFGICQWQMVLLDAMKDTLVIDKAGRVVLPHPVRKRFRLRGGSRLSLQVESDAIVLRPIDQKTALVSDRGLLVHEGEPEADLVSIVDDIRERRDRNVAGDSR